MIIKSYLIFTVMGVTFLNPPCPKCHKQMIHKRTNYANITSAYIDGQALFVCRRCKLSKTFRLDTLSNNLHAAEN